MSSTNKKTDAKVDAIEMSTVARALSTSARWTKEQILPVVFYVRLCVFLIIGIVYGFARITGFAGVLSSLFLGQLICYLYYAKYLNVDCDDIGHWELMSEGAMPAIANFVLVWLTIFSLQQ